MEAAAPFPFSYSYCPPSLDFLDVNDTTGQGLFDVLLEELKSLELDVDNVRGQGYENTSNMKGKNIGGIEEGFGYKSKSILFSLWLS